MTAVQQGMLKQHGIAEGRVVETEHPYAARSHSWSQTVRFESAKALKARFRRLSDRDRGDVKRVKMIISRYPYI